VNRVRASLGPLWPYAILIAVPAAIFILPDLFGGHLLMSGDNVQQNYPLHVLTGSMMRHGQLPLWDSYIFSGSPLLAGFNAGAFYPLVGFFVIFPDRVAWIATEVVLFAGIGIGMYAFLRALALSTVACLLGALTFTFAGTVFNQVNHVDMTEGFVAVPFMLLAVLRIIRDGRWRWSVVLGVGFALVILGGAPEAMLDTGILVVLYAGISAGLSRDSWWRVLTRGAAASALALSLGAIQWLPGLSAIANSQRGMLGSSFAGSGSYSPRDSLLGLVPYLYGGFGHLNEAQFFSSYNLPEVGIYLGILPIVALLVMWIPKWPTQLIFRERMTWYAIGVIGVLLAFGSYTPLEHLFNLLPLYGHQRLQSRNMIDFSAVACVLFAGWVDRKKDGTKSWVAVDRLTSLVPLAIVLVLLGLVITEPKWFIIFFTGAGATYVEVHTVRVASMIAAGVCLLAAVVVWLRSLLPSRWWIPLMSLFVVLDVGFVGATGQLSVIPPNDLISGTTSVENYVAAHLAPGGRFVVYDPQNYSEAPSGTTGLPDYNILAGLPSIAGYSSIVNNGYNVVTQTHTVAELDLASFRSGKFDNLSLQVILTLPEYFLLPLSNQPTNLADVQQISESAGDDPAIPSGTRTDWTGSSYPFYPAPRPAIHGGEANTWFFGEALRSSTASLVFSSPLTHATIRFGTIDANGKPTWHSPVQTKAGARSVTSSLADGSAYGLTVQVLSGSIPSHQAIVTADSRSYELDGALSNTLHPGSWHQAGSVDGHSLFVRNVGPQPFRTLTSGSQPGPRVSVLSSNANVETVRLHAPSSLVLVRSVAWDKGWSASVSVNGRGDRHIEVSPYGLVQEVHLPAGHDVVTFRYRPTHFVLASLFSIGALIFLVVLAAVMSLRVRRRGRSATTPEALATDQSDSFVQPETSIH